MSCTCILRIAVRGLRSLGWLHRYIGNEDDQNPWRTLSTSTKRLVRTPSMTGRGDDESQGTLHAVRAIENLDLVSAALGGTGASSWGPAKSPASRSQKPHEPLAVSKRGGPQRHALVSALKPHALRSRIVGKSGACSSCSRRHEGLGEI